MLLLDAQGRVELASAGAARLWAARGPSLVGELLPNLLVLEVTSQDPDWLTAQWEVLQAAAVPRAVSLLLRRPEAGPQEMQVRLEPTATVPIRYFAYLTPPADRPEPAASGRAGPPVATLPDLLAARSPLGFFDLDFLRRATAFSPGWKRMLGYTETTLPDSYETWVGLIHPDDTAAAPDRLTGRGPTTGVRPFSVEYRLRHAAGHYVWVQSVGVQVYGPNGALQRVVGAHLDIHERKEAEEGALRAEERLALLAAAGRLALFDLDFAGDRTWLSPACQALLGYADAELPDSPDSFLRVLPPGETTGGLAAYFLTATPGQTVSYAPLRLRHRQGTEIWVYAGTFRLFSRQRELERVLGFLAPMPAGAAGAAPGSLPAEVFSALLVELREGVLISEACGRVVHLNATAARLLGCDAASAAGRPAADLFRPVHRGSHLPTEHPIDRALSRHEPTPLTSDAALEGDGGAPPRPIVYSCRPVDDAAGNPAGAVLVFRDPEEMSLTPEELVRANRFEALGQLAGGIAHDYNNLLTTILGGLSLAKDAHDHSGLENSESACFAAKALSKQLLAFAKGGVTTRQVLPPGDLLAEAVRLSTAGSAVKVTLSVPAEVGAIRVDRGQVLQVFQNLLINAIQAMPAGQGRIEVTAGNVTLAAGQVPPLAHGPYVAVAVRDNGSGIPPEHLQRIFAPFFTTKKTGTGLGLATVLSLVRRHGGQLGVESEPGVGTTFTVFLPRADLEAEVTARRVPALLHSHRTGRILCMDDDPQISALTAGMLDHLGYKYDLARHGAEAIQLYQRYLRIGRPHDVVLLDLTVIGGMGGEECFRQLRDLHPGVRAIVASGYDNEAMARQFLAQGFCGFLAKPYRLGDLNRILKQVVGE